MRKVLRLSGNLPDELPPGGVWTANNRPKSALDRWYPTAEIRKKRQQKKVRGVALETQCAYIYVYMRMYVSSSMHV
jgi:hypothetical protein